MNVATLLTFLDAGNPIEGQRRRPQRASGTNLEQCTRARRRSSRAQ